MSRTIRPILFVSSTSSRVEGALPDIEMTNVVRDLRPKLMDANEEPAPVPPPVAEEADMEGSGPKDPDSSAIESASGSDSETSEKSTPGSVLVLNPEPGQSVSLETSEPSVLAEKVKGLTAPVTLGGKGKPPVAG